MNTIVVPLDGSPLAEHVLPYAHAAAQLFDAELRLVRVIPIHPEPMSVEFMSLVTVAEQLSEEQRIPAQAISRDAYEQAEGYLFSHAAWFRERGLHTTTEVRTGLPDEEIIAAALDQDATMIAMATHGRSGLRRWTLGSVADKVVRSSHIPVLLIRATAPAPAEWHIRRILVPLDGSDLAAQALPLAREVATHAHAELMLVRAIVPLADIDTYWVPVSDDTDIIRRKEAQEQFRAMTDELQAAGLKSTSIVSFGYPAEIILEEAAQQHADLIVLATHGYSGLRRVTLGSVADRVLHAATTPLLLVRPAVA